MNYKDLQIEEIEKYNNEIILQDLEKKAKSQLILSCCLQKDYTILDKLLNRLKNINEQYYLQYGSIIIKDFISSVIKKNNDSDNIEDIINEIELLCKKEKIEFPIFSLPIKLQQLVKAISEDLQVNVDMVAVCILTIYSTVLQGNFKVHIKNDWYEPLNLFCIVIAPPSERKSPVLNILTKPLLDYEKEENERLKPIIVKNKLQKEMLNSKRQNLLKNSKSKSNDNNINELEELTKEISEFKEEKYIKIFTDDVTSEKLVSLLIENNNKMAIISSEGGIFELMKGKYENSINFDVYLKGYSNDTIKVDRIGRESEISVNPKLTMFLMIQPSVLQNIIRNTDFKGKGLLARFLYCSPTSTVGTRKFDTQKVDDELYHWYHLNVKELLKLNYKEDKKLELEVEALQKFKEFYEFIELKLNNEYEGISEWCGKLLGNIARISGILAIIENKEATVIRGDIMGAAISIGKFFLKNELNIFTRSTFSTNIIEAEYILDYIIKEKLFHFKIREIVRNRGRYQKNSDASQGLEELINRKYIFYDSVQNEFLVNPKLYE